MTFAGVEFDYIKSNERKYLKKLDIKGEYDIMLINCDSIALIETKYRVRHEDVLELATKKLDNFRILYTEYKNYKVLLGVGGMYLEDEAEREAKQRGIAIIKVIGDKVELYTEGIKIY
jgi:hypothetical protein